MEDQIKDWSGNLQESSRAIVGAAVGYSLTHGLIRRFSTSDPSTVTFLINSITSASFGIYSFLSSGYEEDVVDGYPPHSTTGLSLFGGYALYDVLARPTVSRDVMVHHVLGALGVLGAMTARKWTFLPASSMIVEVTLFSVYWLDRVKREHAGLADLERLKTASLVRVLTTLLFRTFLIPLLVWRSYSMLKRQLRRASTDEKRVAFRDVLQEFRRRMPSWVLSAHAINASVFSVLNIQWTIQMIQSYHRRYRPRRLA